MKSQSRRGFIKTSLGGAAGLVLLPNLIPSRLLGADAPSKKINVAQIGCGRMGRSDLGNVLTEPLARVVAVCDLDSHRLAEGKAMAEDYYTKQGESGVNVKTCLLYTSDAADDLLCVDLGGRRVIKKKKQKQAKARNTS